MLQCTCTRGPFTLKTSWPWVSSASPWKDRFEDHVQVRSSQNWPRPRFSRALIFGFITYKEVKISAPSNLRYGHKNTNTVVDCMIDPIGDINGHPTTKECEMIRVNKAGYPNVRTRYVRPFTYFCLGRL